MVTNVLDSLFARVYDPVMARVEAAGLAEQRISLLGGLEGDVLEIGAGTGANVEAYPTSLRSLTLTDPTPQMVQRLRNKIAEVRPGVTIQQATAEDLPYEDGSFDAVVSTLVLCSVGDLGRALAEIRRVLRPGGRLVLYEHVQAAGATAHAQFLLEPVQRVVARGCRLTRDIRTAVRHAGFDVGAVVDGEMRAAPKLVRTVVSGVATLP